MVESDEMVRVSIRRVSVHREKPFATVIKPTVVTTSTKVDVRPRRVWVLVSRRIEPAVPGLGAVVFAFAPERYEPSVGVGDDSNVSVGKNVIGRVLLVVLKKKEGLSLSACEPVKFEDNAVPLSLTQPRPRPSSLSTLHMRSD